MTKARATVPIKDVCTVKTGKRDANHGNPQGAYPFFTCADDVSRIDDFNFDGDAILIAGNGNFNVKHFSGKFDAYQRTYVLQDFRINHRFLFYYILANLKDITKDHRGSTVQYIRLTNIADYPVTIFDTAEQEKIVAKIEELFSEIENTETNLLRSSALLKGYWSAAFEKLYKDEGEATLLSDCIELSQNGLAKRNSKSGIDYKVLRLADIKNKSITQNSARYIKLENKEIEKYKLLPDDLVAIRVNGSRELVGNLIYYPKDEEWAYCDHFIRLRAREGVLNPLYLKYYFETQFVKNYLKQKMVSTAGQNTISQGSLLSLMIPMVPMEKQAEIVMKAKEIESELLSLNKQIATLLKQCKTNKQTILSKAFKGELV